MSSKEAQALLDLAVGRPHEALTQATSLLADKPDPLQASYARQAIGIVRRDLGELGPAIRELRAALRLARRTGSPGRQADILASLGVALVLAGRTTAALDSFADAVALAHGPVLSRVLVRRGAVYSGLGRHDASIADLRSAAERCRREGEPVWEARALVNLVMSLLAIGDVTEAEVAAARAEELFSFAGQELEAAKALHNLGLVAFQSGSLPQALARLAEAERRYDALLVDVHELAQERCAVLLAAGLAADAVLEVDAAIDRRPSPYVLAELLVAGAAAALAAGDDKGAQGRATEADGLLSSQGRPAWALRARFLQVSASPVGSRAAAAAAQVADSLSAARAEEAPHAHLLAGQLAKDSVQARRHLLAASAGRARRPALGRASGELAVALLARAEGRHSAVTRACERGFDALDEHRLTLGAPDLRALASGHGRELTALALEQVLRSGKPRAVLHVTERTRAASLTIPGPPPDAELFQQLAALRDATRRLEEARAAGEPTAQLTRERADRERAVRRQRHLAEGTGGASASRLDVSALLAALGATTLLELVEFDGTLHALVAARGRVRRIAVGPAAAAAAEAAHAAAGLRRAAYGRPPDLGAVGRRLQETLLGPAARWLRGGPVVVVPPSELHSIPWCLLPSLASIPVSVSPSAALWLRSVQRPEATGPVTLVAGPELRSGGAEIDPLTALYPMARVLRGPDATVRHVLDALDGARLAHVAAHGDFRTDSPLFSSLRLADGPLTAYDLEQLQQPPHRLVLSSCDTGAAASVGGDDLLGFATALLGLGTIGVLAAVVPVNDAASVTVATSLHRQLASGAEPAAALLAARQEASHDPLAAATAGAFLAFGA
jgi:tetratricopeptide (TPR) repeat protein